ncbi:MAG: YebC/PmpR family DNA-binding transcriptional regulator [Proteobacteria bacterium]|jgi:YebC/PmpR family DNA-binding regulatory protein|nr:YebC/PmpR family DNA-binding transcriptional regulator [Pseudomonadota bacterium]
MAGHSKWANIKFRKAAQDSKRGKLFTKHIREITVAAREGGADSANNPRLRTAVDKALGVNMTRDTVEKAIKRGTGDLEGVNYEEVRYEGYAPSGIAVLVECTTDNRNRTVSEVRHAFSKYGGNMGNEGSVAFLFERFGMVLLAEGTDEEQVMEIVLEAGAEDLETHDDGSVEVTTPPEAYHAVVTALADAGFTPVSSEIVQRAAIETPLSVEDAEKVLKLVDAIEELDDVHDVFTNADFPDSVLEG